MYLLCDPNQYIDPRGLVTTTTTVATSATSITTAIAPATTTTTTTPPDVINATSPAAQVDDSQSKSNKNNNNSSLYYLIIGIVAGAVVLVLIITIIILIRRKQKTVEKPTGNGLIGHMMRQRSTLSQAHSVYSNHAQSSDEAAGGIDVVTYDYSGILETPVSSPPTGGVGVTSKSRNSVRFSADYDNATPAAVTSEVTTSEQEQGESNQMVCYL